MTTTHAYTETHAGWRDRALCRLFDFLPWTNLHDGIDRVGTFARQRDQMIAVCEACPVQPECAADVAAIDDARWVTGVWAGMVGEKLANYVRSNGTHGCADLDELEAATSWDPDDLDWS